MHRIELNDSYGLNGKGDEGDVQNDSMDIETEELMRVNPQNDLRDSHLNPNMAPLSTQEIAKRLIPKVSVLKKALKSADLYIKFDRIMEEFNSLLYYNSIIEIAAWVIGFLCFISYPSQMGIIWMHILHLGRGGYGLFLVIKKTPKNYDLIESISEVHNDQLDEHWGFEKMAKHIRDNFRKHLIDLLTKDKKFYLIYVIVSWVAMLLDMIGFLVQLIKFGTSGDEYSDLFMLGVTIIFLYTLFNYFFWVITFYFRIEPKYRKDAMRAGMGFANGLKSRIQENYHNYKGKMFPKNDAPKPPTRGLNPRNENSA
ncbi:unnamed protein product [Moneuplotes crassus]|uniref:Uncharacterized protein n=1 Tax=Euplotes crassus TaxID=5936 RepID=A0AAD2CZS3_EUPCR|nr:unnamed protein product [Moneuplotes crassus]